MTDPTGRRKPGRPYCEAFPAIDVHDVLRAAAAGLRFLQWEDEDGLIIGHIAMLDLTEDRYRFHSRFFGTRNVESGNGAQELAIHYRKAGKYWNKPSWACGGCGRNVTRVFYVRGEWCCKSCHNLLSIVQRLDPVNKAIYQRDQLRSQLTPLGATSKPIDKIEKKRAKYGNAVRRLADEQRVELPEHLQHRSIGRWLGPDELPKTEVAPDEIGYGWVPGMWGSLPGLERVIELDMGEKVTKPALPPEPDPARSVSRSGLPGRGWDLSGLRLLTPPEWRTKW